MAASAADTLKDFDMSKAIRADFDEVTRALREAVAMDQAALLTAIQELEG